MSQRRTTVPPTRESSRSPHSGRSGLIAREKTKKQSAKKRTALDNRFHRTFFHSQPPRAFTLRQRDPQGRTKRGAEAPGQRTARGRLLLKGS